MVVHDENALNCASHSKVFIVVLEALKAGGDAGVFFWLSFFCTVVIRIQGMISVCTRRGDLPEGEIGKRVPKEQLEMHKRRR